MCMHAYKISYFLTQLKSCFWTLTKNDMADKRFSFVMEADVQKVRDNRTPENTIKHTIGGARMFIKHGQRQEIPSFVILKPRVKYSSVCQICRR